jgi:hypothetical protein
MVPLPIILKKIYFFKIDIFMVPLPRSKYNIKVVFCQYETLRFYLFVFPVILRNSNIM